MKNFKRFLCAICVFVTVLGAPLSVMAANDSDHCGSGTYQITGGYTYSGNSAHMYRGNICNYTYKKDVKYRHCIVCGHNGATFGNPYDEKHQRH